MNNNVLKFSFLIIIIFTCWLLGRFISFDLDQFRKLLLDVPVVVSGFLFVLLYIVTTTFLWFGPKDILRLSAAMIFGAYISTAFVTIAELGNCYILFSLSRFLGRDYVCQKFKIKDNQLNKVKKDSGFFGVVAFRLNLLFPLRLIDLGYGLTKINFKKYFIISLISTPFRIFIQQYIMALVGEKIVTDISYTIGAITNDSNIILYSSMYMVALLFITCLAIIMRNKRKMEKGFLV